MAISYSLAHLSVLGCPPPEMIYIAARAGYEYVSPRMIYMGLPGEPKYELADSPELLRQTRRALDYTGVKVLDIELARVYDDMYPSKYLPAMEVAAELGARAMLSSIWTPNIEYATEKFAQICDLAKPFGLTVDLEYLPTSSVNNLAKAADLLRSVNRPNAGLMVDMHHFHRARDKPEDLEGLPPEWFHFVHLSDAGAEIPADTVELTRIMREECLYLGEGDIDVASVLKRLPKVVYAIETPHVARTRSLGYAEHAFRLIEAARAYMAKHDIHQG